MISNFNLILENQRIIMEKQNIVIWVSLIIIALIIASIDVMTSKIVALTPEKEPTITKIVFIDVWFKIAVLMFFIPAIFVYYQTNNTTKSVFVMTAGWILIFFGLEDVFYFLLKSIWLPDILPWLDNSPFISLFGLPVTSQSLLFSTGFALAASFSLVVLIPENEIIIKILLIPVSIFISAALFIYYPFVCYLGNWFGYCRLVQVALLSVIIFILLYIVRKK